MVTELSPLMEENEPTNDWVSKNQTIIFRCDEYVMRIQADYDDFDNDKNTYQFASEMPKDEAIKLAKGILLSFNAL